MTCEVTLCEALANNWQLLAKVSLNKSSLPDFPYSQASHSGSEMEQALPASAPLS